MWVVRFLMGLEEEEVATVPDVPFERARDTDSNTVLAVPFRCMVMADMSWLSPLNDVTLVAFISSFMQSTAVWTASAHQCNAVSDRMPRSCKS